MASRYDPVMRIAGALLVVCTGLPAQVASSPQPSPSPAQRATRLARELELPERRHAAIDGLLVIGAPAVDALVAQASHPDLAIAQVALQVLAELGHDGLAAVPKLQQLAGTRDAHARAAGWALARLPHRGTFLVPSMADGVVREFDADGKLIWTSGQVGKPWSATVLASGHLLVADLDGGAREYDASGKMVWEWAGKNVYTAERLIDGNTLCAEFGQKRVVEIDARGEIVWTHGSVLAISARRLPDGTTFLVDYGARRLLEVGRDGGESWSLDSTANVYAAQRLRDGSVLYGGRKAGPATLRDRQGEVLRTVPTREQGSAILLLPDGTIQCGEGYVRRCNADGSERWLVAIGGWVGHVTPR